MADPSHNNTTTTPSPSTPSSFTILPALYPQDLAELCDIYYTAFAAHPDNMFWWSPTREQMTRWLEYRVTTKFADPDVRHYKIVDAGQIVAWARWDIPRGASGFGTGGLTTTTTTTTTTGTQQKEEKDGVVKETQQQQQKYPEGTNPAWCEAFFAQLKQVHERWDAGKMLGLSLIATHPNHQRRGAAKALIEPILALADAQGLRTYLEATPQGRPVYERLGFREVEELVFDVAQITAGEKTGVSRLSIMIREPGAGTGTGAGATTTTAP